MAAHTTTASMNNDNESNFYSHDDWVSCMMGPLGVF